MLLLSGFSRVQLCETPERAPNRNDDPEEREAAPTHAWPLGLALGSPFFPSGCEGKLGVALESPQGRRDLT